MSLHASVRATGHWGGWGEATFAGFRWHARVCYSSDLSVHGALTRNVCARVCDCM